MLLTLTCPPECGCRAHHRVASSPGLLMCSPRHLKSDNEAFAAVALFSGFLAVNTSPMSNEALSVKKESILFPLQMLIGLRHLGYLWLLF